jgi:hypothetical protein
LKYYDLATKVIKEEEDPELSPKKAPFNSTDPRFKEVKVPIIGIVSESWLIFQMKMTCLNLQIRPMMLRKSRLVLLSLHP